MPPPYRTRHRLIPQLPRSSSVERHRWGTSAMQRFFFDIDDGSFHRDSEGTDLRDEKAAQEEAVRALTEMARDLIPTALPSGSIRMWVRDEHLRPLMELSISMTIKRTGQA